MSEDLERDSVWKLAEESETMHGFEQEFFTPEKTCTLPNKRLQRRRLQYRKMIQAHPPHYLRTRSQVFIEQPSDSQASITTDGRSKATFCMAASFSRKQEADREVASSISLYAKMCKRSEIKDYATKEINRHPDARCIYVPKRVRHKSSSLQKTQDFLGTPLQIFRPHVFSRTILPPLKGASLKVSKEPKQ